MSPVHVLDFKVRLQSEWMTGKKVERLESLYIGQEVRWKDTESTDSVCRSWII